MKHYVSIDIGGTYIKHGLIAGEGVITTKSCIPTEAWQGGTGIFQKVKEIIEAYSAGHELAGICISTAGMVDCEKGEVFFSGELIPDYSGTNFKQRLEAEYGIPCEVENDVNCAALAEYQAGAAAGSKTAVCLTLGTGIGGCILIDGKVFHGFGNSACEIGYMKMRGSDFQTLGASSILSKKVSQIKGENWDGLRIFEEAKKGDAVCLNAIDEMADVLGEGIANICYVVNPEVVVLGGGVAAQEQFLKPKVAERLEVYLKPVIFERTTIAFARQRNDAGMLGAYYHFHAMRSGG
ncbi:ROK family protein [Bariatricus massiliensis]|uniref:ROK family protein n=1 Tax=Bariatricus massiliensis TaxID=1745713 RepID=A0ABS8DH77_9FIRM|nr:ROK family protein [Bariatricus massiliensis]MCB7304766.1 ROK family protein [Bariatricus massiliensis]MCB7375320.1 ROK family protein [Bariatricus massiliensis]MCB7387780.1 ROK family protein [Bariatricus massiliensis]MCB7412131.1 ROK family protein [Bariatricus massiliensis]MCQ5254488.1 ROK family protein [Bariatricus massiliensis]